MIKKKKLDYLAKPIGKVLFVPHFKGKTVQLHVYQPYKWVLLSLSLIVVAIFSIGYFQFRFYSNKLTSLLSDNSVTNSSMNQISLDGVQIKRELARLKMEADAMDKFIAQAKQFDKDVAIRLSLPYSPRTFTDFFRSHAKKYDATHPASDSQQEVALKDKATLIKESIERQKTYNALMDVTPSAYPLDGTVITEQTILPKPSLVLKAPIGTPVHATATGKVSSMEKKEIGYEIQIIHQNPNNNKNIKTIYYFCDKPTITVNQQIKKGQVIAYVGQFNASGQSILGYQVLIDKNLIKPK